MYHMLKDNWFGLVWFGVNYDMDCNPSRDYSVALCIILMFT